MQFHRSARKAASLHALKIRRQSSFHCHGWLPASSQVLYRAHSSHFRFGHAPCSVDQICAIWNLIVVKMPRTTNSKSTASWVNTKGGSDCFGASALSVGSFWKA